MLDLDPTAYIALPPPISTNNLFINVPGRGRVMSKNYKVWKRLVAQVLAAQNPLPRFALPVEITFYVGERGIGPMDSDNTAKAYLDALKVAGVIHDDSRKWVRRSGAVWVPAMGGCVAKIKVARAELHAPTIMGCIKPGFRGLLT